MKVLDLYSGMGGLSLGFALALKNVEIFGIDIDRDAVETYNMNLNRFGAKAIRADALKWEPKDDFDLVIGGVPCQPWSYANSHSKDKRGEKHSLAQTLPRFFDLVAKIKPKAFLMENVEGLATRYRNVLERELAKVVGNYNTTYAVLNSADYGVPQRRRRLFVFGIRKDLRIRPSLPLPTHSADGTALAKWITTREAIGDLLSIPPANAVFLTAEQLETMRKRGKPIAHHLCKTEAPIPLDRSNLRTVTSTHITTPANNWNSDWATRVIPLDMPSYTIVEKHRSGQFVETPYGYRKLSVRETMRLQSFPDWYVFPPSVSISKMYRLVGDAVPPILAYKLARHIGRLFGLDIKAPKYEDWQLPYFDKAFWFELSRDSGQPSQTPSV